MYRLVNSSEAGAVERDHALRLLTARAVLTRAICWELRDSPGCFSDRCSSTALSLLLQWVWQNLPESIRTEPHASGGIESMAVPDDYKELLGEIRNGAQVCEALSMLLTADNSLQRDGDQATLQKRRDDYWTSYPTAVAAPR